VLDKFNKPTTETKSFSFSKHQLESFVKGGGTISQAIKCTPSSTIIGNESLAYKYKDQFVGQKGRFTILMQFYPGPIWTIDKKFCELFYADDLSEKTGEDNNVYWNRVKTYFTSLYGNSALNFTYEKDNTGKKTSKIRGINVIGARTGHMSALVEFYNPKTKHYMMFGTELVTPDIMMIDDEMVQTYRTPNRVPGRIRGMSHDDVGTIGMPQDVVYFDAPFISDRYKS
ncbi:unnamed protein product, partial [Discosporangium mesarthrocarpum]